jgi:hypothetical protein
MRGNQRLSASVDAGLLDAAQVAVDEGRGYSISAWVNDALRLKAEHDRRMQALDSRSDDRSRFSGGMPPRP